MLNIRIEVHTDPLGDPDANMALTYKQGDMLKDYLVKKFGVGEKRIEVVGYGGSRPIASVNEPGGAERNRRVEIFIKE
jgi:outer membrane protein OmpA-like peptidoglycan-associated protein